MTRKHKNPQQPPEWFAQWSKNVFEAKIKALEENQTKDHKLLQKITSYCFGLSNLIT